MPRTLFTRLLKATARLFLYPCLLCTAVCALGTLSIDESRVIANAHSARAGQAGAWPDWPPDIAGLVLRFGYPFEAHFCTTDDGYILELFRLPLQGTGNATSMPVLLVHGLLVRASSDRRADHKIWLS